MVQSARSRAVLTLYTTPDDIQCHRVRLLLAAKGVSYERVMVEPTQDQHLATRQQGRVDLEARILGRCADESDGAVLHIREEAVLLRPIEAMDLVHEKQRLLPRFRRGPRFGKNLL